MLAWWKILNLQLGYKFGWASCTR